MLKQRRDAGCRTPRAAPRVSGSSTPSPSTHDPVLAILRRAAPGRPGGRRGPRDRDFTVSSPLPDGELGGDQVVVDWEEPVAHPQPASRCTTPRRRRRRFVEQLEHAAARRVVPPSAGRHGSTSTPKASRRARLWGSQSAARGAWSHGRRSGGGQPAPTTSRCCTWAARGVAMGRAPDGVRGHHSRGDSRAPWERTASSHSCARCSLTHPTRLHPSYIARIDGVDCHRGGPADGLARKPSAARAVVALPQPPETVRTPAPPSSRATRHCRPGPHPPGVPQATRHSTSDPRCSAQQYKPASRTLGHQGGPRSEHPRRARSQAGHPPSAGPPLRRSPTGKTERAPGHPSRPSVGPWSDARRQQREPSSSWRGSQTPGDLGAMLRTTDAAGVAAVVAADPVTDWGDPNIIRRQRGDPSSPSRWPPPRPPRPWPFLARSRRSSAGRHHPRHRPLYTDADLTGRWPSPSGPRSTAPTTTLLAAAAYRVRIPMQGKANSLNVAASAAIVLFEALRQRTAGRPG